MGLGDLGFRHLGTTLFRFWGLGQGDLGFRGGTWRQPFRFWGLGQGEPGLLGGLKGCRGWDKGTRGLGVGLRDLKGCRGWDKGTRVLGGKYIQTTQGMDLP